MDGTRVKICGEGTSEIADGMNTFSQLMDEAWDYHENGKNGCAFEKLHSAVWELSNQMQKSRGLPESIQQALNEGDGSYKP